MSKPTLASVSPLRFARIVRWAQLSLLRAAAWIAHLAGISAPLSRAVTRAIKPGLDKMALLACALILIQAHALITFKPRRQGRPCFNQNSAGLRALFGSHLRRMARARDARARIAALCAMLARVDALAARLAKRLAHGLSRRRGGFKLEPRALKLAWFSGVSFACADTS